MEIVDRLNNLYYEAPSAEEVDFLSQTMTLLASLSIEGEIEDFEDYGDM